MTARKFEGIPPLEWAAAALGLVLVSSALAFLIFQSLTASKGPPRIEAHVTRVSAHVVEFEARNSADSTAASVVIEGTLSRDGVVVETAEVTLDYVPAESARTGGLFFHEDPATGILSLHPLGYQTP